MTHLFLMAGLLAAEPTIDVKKIAAARIKQVEAERDFWKAQAERMAAMIQMEVQNRKAEAEGLTVQRLTPPTCTMNWDTLECEPKKAKP